MSFGTPVVGFAVGGISDYLLDKETGLLVRETTADALRAALTQVIDNPEQIAVWGRNARNLVTRTYTKAVHLAALRRIYIEVREVSMMYTGLTTAYGEGHWPTIGWQEMSSRHGYECSGTVPRRCRAERATHLCHVADRGIDPP